MSRKGGDRVLTINMPLDLLYVGGCNVRGSDPFRDVEGSELLESIREKGIIQPIVARYTDDKYEVVCGARRYACAKALGLERVPVTIISLSDVEALELSLIENVQRQNLSVEDEAKAYAKLIEAHGSMREVSRRTGVSHVHILQALMCHEAQKRLQPYGINVERVSSSPRRGNSVTTLPIKHAVLLEQTFKSLEKSGKLTPEELDRRYVEAAKLIARLSQREVGELLKRLAQSPERPLDELMGDTHIRSTSQKTHRLRIPEHLYGRLSEEAGRRGVSVEDLTTLIIEEWLEGKRLKRNRTTEVEQS